MKTAKENITLKLNIFEVESEMLVYFLNWKKFHNLCFKNGRFPT